MGKVGDEINEMINALGGTGETEREEAPVEEPTPTEEPVEEPKEEPKEEPEETPKEDEPEPPKEEPKEDELKEDDEPKEDEPTPEENKDEIIKGLRERISDMEGRAREPEPAEKPPEKEPETPDTPATPPPAHAEAIDFIGDEDIEELTGDKEGLNKLLNAVYQRGVSDSEEKVLRDIPEIVRTNVALNSELAETSRKFYTDNPDLAGFKPVVAAVFEEVSSKNADKNMGDLLPIVEKEVRTRLQLHKKAVEPDKKIDKKDNPPKLPTVGRKAGEIEDKPDTSSMESEISEMNKTVRR